MSVANDLEDWAEKALENDIVGWLTTVTPEGEPQTSVVGYLWTEGEIVIYTMPNAPKVRNIQANAAVSFNLNTDRYGDRWVSIEGVARIDANSGSMADHAAMSAKYAEPLEHWQMDAAEVSDLVSTVIWIRPTKVRSGL